MRCLYTAVAVLLIFSLKDIYAASLVRKETSIPINQQFTQSDLIDAARARATLYSIYSNQIVKQGGHKDLIHGVLVSIDQDLALFSQEREMDWKKTDLRSKSLLLAYAGSDDNTSSTDSDSDNNTPSKVESLDAILQSALNGDANSQKYISASLSEDFSSFKEKYDSNQITTLELFARMLTHEGTSTLSDVMSGLKKLATIKRSGLETELPSITAQVKALYDMDHEFCNLVKEELSNELTQIEEHLDDILSGQDANNAALEKGVEDFWDTFEGYIDTPGDALEREVNAMIMEKAGWK